MAISKKTVKTNTLLNRLFKTVDLIGFLDSNRDAMDLPSFGERITQLARARGVGRSGVIRCSGIERSYGYQLFNGIRKPSRDKALQLAFGFHMEVEEAQALLRDGCFSPLYPKIRRDAAVIFGLHQKLNIQQMQELLSSLNLTLLGGEETHD